MRLQSGTKSPPNPFNRTPPRFAQRLRKRRLQLGLTEKQAAMCVGASAARFRHWESGKGAPGPGYLPALLLFIGYVDFPPGRM